MEQVSIEKRENRFVQDLLGPDDKLLIESMRDFVDTEIMPLRREIEASTRTDFKLFDDMQQKLLALGLQGGFLPEEYGGMGMSSALTTSLLAEELSRGEPSLFYSLAGGYLALRPAVLAENKAVLEHFAPSFLKEDEVYLGCFAVTEPTGGSDIENVNMAGQGIDTQAELSGGKWVIDGAKIWPVNSGVADAYCVVCSTDPSLGEDGIALIYVETPTQGFKFGKLEDKEGMRGSRTGDLHFKNVRVPEGWRASDAGRDAELLRDNLAFARIFSGGMAIGMAQGAFDEVMAFTTDRVAAGKPIRQHTICATILADIAIGIQVGRDAYVNAAYIFDRPETYGPGHSRYMLSRASAVKVFCCDAAIHATNRAMELMGSYGYVTDYHVEKYWRDSKLMQLWEGGAQLGRFDVNRGYYDFDQFHPNELYEHIQKQT
jgi:alkylation response protein AidB-like acyl-CoA dehydrogenase